MDTIIKTATITSKGQITIPQQVRELLSLNTGDSLRFIINTSSNQITVEKEIIICPICKGTKEIGNTPCFVCGETGIFEDSNSTFMFISQLHKYRIPTTVIWHEHKDGLLTTRDFPLIQLFSNDYPQEVIDKFQDYLQAKAIMEYAADRSIDKLGGVKLIEIFKTENARNHIEEQVNPLYYALKQAGPGSDVFSLFFGKKE
ncbi:AbrB/MazE/SpoVT family DNA-binding domain-containing protein [Brevibacillus sp. 179-C9.3 HS]|uniref:AbrB/MazE/SpoVT family DNA-binding domain-containing protein n=1 Tax=unclassified Brevibacillus TaxID=2684853 RepID=UPI0039A198A9